PCRPVDDLGITEAIVVGDPRIGRDLNKRKAPHRAGNLQIVTRLAAKRQDVRHLYPHSRDFVLPSALSFQRRCFPLPHGQTPFRNPEEPAAKVRKHWPMDLARLIQIARGAEPADLLLTNARVLDLYACDIIPADVAIVGGRIAASALPVTAAYQA